MDDYGGVFIFCYLLLLTYFGGDRTSTVQCRAVLIERERERGCVRFMCVIFE